MTRILTDMPDDSGDNGGMPQVDRDALRHLDHFVGTSVEMATQRLVETVAAHVPGEIDLPVLRAMAKQAVYNLMAFAKKHQDYGRGNIAQGGEVGLLIRMNDKIQRIMNLHHTACTPNHEGLTDSVNDLAIYGTIMQVLRQGNWPGADERWAL
jgi:hypothetical protein